MPLTDRERLRSYYDHEAQERRRQPLTGQRVTLRTDYIELLRAEERRSVLDFGAGPGHDGPAFIESGIQFVGIDLAHANCQLAAERQLTVIHASVDAIPVRPDSFDAGWSMSTLMHLPHIEMADSLRAMAEPLRSGAPLAVGLWGGTSGTVVESETGGYTRPFHLRPFETNRDLVRDCGAIEQTEVWDVGPDGWDYQVFVVRMR